MFLPLIFVRCFCDINLKIQQDAYMSAAMISNGMIFADSTRENSITFLLKNVPDFLP